MAGPDPWTPGTRADQQAAYPARPLVILRAVQLMCAGAVINILSAAVTLAQSGSWRSEIHKANPQLTASQLTSDVNSLTTEVVVTGLVGTILWLWMAWASNRAHNWARIVSTVLFGLYTVELVEAVASSGSAAFSTLSAVPGVVSWGIGLATIIFLWRPESTDFFKGYR